MAPMAIDTTKPCVRCGQLEWRIEPIPRKDGKNRVRCVECKRRYGRTSYRNAIKPIRYPYDPAKHRFKAYGITDEQYSTLLESQNGTCAVCPSTVDLCVDHDHLTGKVRGILCGRHNRGLGLLGDTLADVQRVLEYLCSGALTR